jgi:hypothetical protein
VKSLSGGQSLSGFEQVVSQFSDRWTATFAFNINSDARVLAFRAFVMSMRGRANTVALPAFDLARAPWAADPLSGRLITPAVARSKRLDGTAFADPSNLRDSLIVASVAANTSLNNTSLPVSVTTGSAPQPGHLFSIGSRLYTVLSTTGSGPSYVLSIWPWLRADVSLGDAVNFTSPSCLMRFQTDAEGADALTTLNQMRFATITLKFDEAPPATSTVELREDGGSELRE